MKSTRTLNADLLLTSLAGLVLPTCLFAQEKAHPPAWAEKGAYVFRVSTPDRLLADGKLSYHLA